MLPNTLIYLADRLAGFSTNVFKMNTVGSSSVNSRGIIEFLLPANSPINLGSFKVNFTASCSGSSAGARLPPDIHSLIQRVEVSCGGITISSGSDYFNVLKAAKSALCGRKACPVTGHPEVVRTVPLTAGGSTLTTTANEALTSSVNQLFTWEHFDGFLGTAMPTILDTGLCPQIRVKITLAGADVLISSAGVALSGTGSTDIVDAGAGVGDFSVSNLSATIEGVSFGDSTYQEMVSALMSKRGYIEIPYKNYYSFSGSHTGSSQFNVSTQSLDRIWWAFRSSGFDTQGGAVLIDGHKVAGGYVNSGATVTSTGPYVSSGTITVTTALNTDIGVPSTDNGGVATYNTNCEKYNAKYFNFVDPLYDVSSSGVSTFLGQLKLNNSSYPDFQATATEWLGISKNSIPMGETLPVMTQKQYHKNYFVGCARLNFPGAEKKNLISGLDTRGVNLSGSLNTSSMTSHNLTIFLETTAVLQLGSGRQLSTVF